MAPFPEQCYPRLVGGLAVIGQRTAAAFLGVVLALSIWTMRAHAQTAPGQPIYKDKCSRCHGANGEGDKAPQLVPFKWTYEKTLDRIRHPECEMPAFTESELSDDDVAQIVTYLKTLKK